MKLILNAPIKREEIASLLDGYQEGDQTIRVTARSGIQIHLEYEGSGSTDEAAALVKKIVRSTDFGKVLTFSVTAG